jgi:hypothetical protein
VVTETPIYIWPNLWNRIKKGAIEIPKKAIGEVNFLGVFF